MAVGLGHPVLCPLPCTDTTVWAWGPSPLLSVRVHVCVSVYGICIMWQPALPVGGSFDCHLVGGAYEIRRDLLEGCLLDLSLGVPRQKG